VASTRSSAVAHRRLAWPLLAAAALAAVACSTESTGFGGGVEPWETPAQAPAEWPAVPAVAGEVAVAAGQRIAAGDTPSHYWAHGRVLLSAPLADVWGAVQWRSGVLVAVYPDVPTVDCEAIERPEAVYSLSYGVKEIPNGYGQLGRNNWFRVDWRGEATRDATQAITNVNLKAQKVDGTTFVVLMRQSVVATPAPGGGTVLEIVRHINAPDESETTAGDWIRLWVAALQAQLAGAPLVPQSYCFP
jgi:hypothetical protein